MGISLNASNMKMSEEEKSYIKSLPKGANIFMAVFTPIIFGTVGLISSTNEFAFLGKWAVPVFVVAGLVIGCIPSFLIFIRPMLQKTAEEYNELDAREHSAERATLERAEELMQQKNSGGKIGKAIVGFISLALVACFIISLILVAISEDVYTVGSMHKKALENPVILVMLAGSVGGLVLLGIGSSIWSSRGYKIKPQNEAHAEGIISKIERGSSVYVNEQLTSQGYRLYVAVDSINKILIARSKIKYTGKNAGGKNYQVGDKILIKYDHTNPKKCVIINE